MVEIRMTPGMKLNLLRIMLLFLGPTLFQQCQVPRDTPKPGWPEITREAKPWTRWWWHGSAVTREGITAEMEACRKAGIGGLEITPIYGVTGAEESFVNYLSPEWMELFIHTLKEAERLDMGIDMATGTGWPFGGPWVGDQDACRNLQHKIYELKGGTRLGEKIEFVQQPYLRAVGNQVYEVHDSFSTEKTIARGSRKEPLARLDPKAIDIKTLKQPIGENTNLQLLALDQVIFERPLPLQVLMAFGDNGQAINLTAFVAANGTLDWTAPPGSWKLYALFEGWHGKMVERAGPGGEGNVIDHFSSQALQHYLSRFDSALRGQDIKTLRAFFNDSYEVDDARGAADWTPALFSEFKTRRGYALEEHLPALFGNDRDEMNERILCDYRETISDLLLDNFTRPWGDWAHNKSAVIRNQAHGAPSNILDLYGAVDIPEIEGVEPLRTKMASSAGNVTGKKLISSESATWLNEHFESNLADVKTALDRFMLNGVNHLFYHGTSYSPPGEPWPGWLFYAAVHLNPRNPLWNDLDALNNYVARCQSLLQKTSPDNDVLLYYPVYDRFSTPGPELIEHFDGIGKQFDNTAFRRGAEEMLQKGFSFDYISDKQLQDCREKNGTVETGGKASYKVLVIPHGKYIPLQTFRKITALAGTGVTVIFLEGLPGSPAGFGNYTENMQEFDKTMKELDDRREVAEGVMEKKVGQGRILLGDRIEPLLSYAGIRRESLPERGIQFIRKKNGGNKTIYFISNESGESVVGFLPISEKASAVVLYDPMSGEFGSASIMEEDNGTQVYVQLNPSQTLIIETQETGVDVAPFPYYVTAGTPVVLRGEWSVSFDEGGPVIPPPVKTGSLTSWTTFGSGDYQAFSGTGNYRISFAKPAGPAEGWLLDLGTVKESADVMVNGKHLATLIGPVYRIFIDGSMLTQNNTLEVRVTNLMANRISDMDRKKMFWRKFYNVNFPSRKAENRKNGLFDASHWEPKESGLLGPVRLIPVTIRK